MKLKTAWSTPRPIVTTRIMAVRKAEDDQRKARQKARIVAKEMRRRKTSF